MVKNITKSAMKVGAIAGGIIITAEFFGAFGKGLLLGQLMQMGDPYAVDLHQSLLNANFHKPRKRFVKWLITDVATWESKQGKGPNKPFSFFDREVYRLLYERRVIL